MALPFFIFVTAHIELFRISLIISVPGVFFTFYIQTIGSWLGIYIGLFFNSFRDRFLKFFVKWFIDIWIIFPYLFLSFIFPYFLVFFVLYYWEKLAFNPINYFDFDLLKFIPEDLDIFNSALLFNFLPLNSIVRDYNCYNLYWRRKFSINHVNLDIHENYNQKMNKDLSKFIGGGYTSYKNVNSLGFLIELLENKNIFVNNLTNYLENLEDNKTYTLLPVVRWIDDVTGLTRSISISESFKVTKFVDIDLIYEKLNDYIIKALYRYDLINSNIELVLMNRVWLDINDFNVKKDDFYSITNTINNSLSKKSNINDLLFHKRFANIENDKYNNIIMDNYGIPIISNGLVNDFRLNENQYINVKLLKNNSKFITVKNFDQIDQNLITWIDTKTDFGFIRNKSYVKYFFNHKNSIFKTEATYNFLDYPEDIISNDQDFKIGALDFETFGNEGIGIQNVYAAGWAINDTFKTKKFYYIQKDANSLDLVKNMIYDLANNLEIDGYTFYAHNLGRFDSVFLIKACILLDDIEIIPKWKENKILSITIKNNANKCKFKILDSIQLINGSLDSLCKSFDIKHKKGIFPHNFINKDRLFYIGDTPDFHYFKNMNINIYNKIKSDNWNLKDEALKYLESDVLGLLEVMLKFNEKIFNLYSLNITNYVTAAKLAVGIYTSNFRTNSKDLKIKMIRGNVEKEIRNSYYGGNVNVLINKMDKGYYYDMNSQYPFAMLNDMPIGNPILSNDTNLDNYFGFVYGEITAPDYERLRVPYIQLRDKNSDIVDCPRGKFSRMIFSEEMKEALKDGYKINVKYGYKFERGKNLFKDYIDTMFEIKKNTKDPVEKALSKLLLNSLYGKFGMRDITSTMKIVSKEESKKITRDYNYSVFADIGEDKVLIKYSSRLPEPLRNLVKDSEDKQIKNPLEGLSRTRGVPSAVHISAAISAYARISINKFKNIPGNPCIMSDTDSVVLSKKLPNSFIGIDIGQMKLEHQIEQGIFIRKKLYALRTIDKKEIVKASGVNSSTLNFEKFKLLLAGNSVLCEALSFMVIWKDLNIDIVNRAINLQGLQHKIIDIKDHYDINFKAIVTYNPPNRKFYFNIFDNLELIWIFYLYAFLEKLLLVLYNSIYKFIYLIVKIFSIPK